MRHKMGNHPEGGVNVFGNRFEADIAPNKKRVDIRDRKGNRMFTLLSREDLEELRDISIHILDGMAE